MFRDAHECDDSDSSESVHDAVRDGDLARIEQLLAEGYDINTFDLLGYTPLHYAVRAEDFEVIKFLLSHGADVNAQADSATMLSDTPLGYVAQTCSLAMAELLLSAGADPRIPGWMQLNALHRAEKRKRGDGPKIYQLMKDAAAGKRPKQQKLR